MIDYDQSQLRRIALEAEGVRWKGIERVLVPRDPLDRVTHEFVVFDIADKPPRCCR